MDLLGFGTPRSIQQSLHIAIDIGLKQEILLFLIRYHIYFAMLWHYSLVHSIEIRNEHALKNLDWKRD